MYLLYLSMIHTIHIHFIVYKYYTQFCIITTQQIGIMAPCLREDFSLFAHTNIYTFCSNLAHIYCTIYSICIVYVLWGKLAYTRECEHFLYSSYSEQKRFLFLFSFFCAAKILNHFLKNFPPKSLMAINRCSM